jgi:hypothetical protein
MIIRAHCPRCGFGYGDAERIGTRCGSEPMSDPTRTRPPCEGTIIKGHPFDSPDPDESLQGWR